jgi:hypothetical protein
MIPSVREGFRSTLRIKKLIVIFYLVNLSFALLVMLPVRSALSSFGGGTLAGEGLANHFDFDFLAEFLHANGTTFSATFMTFLAAGTLYWLANLFLSGGAYATFWGGDTPAPETFWAGAGKYFGRFLRLGLWSVIALGVFYLVQFTLPLAIHVIFGKDPYQSIVWWGNWIRTGVGLLGIILYFIVVDYGKLYIVSSGDHRGGRALVEGVRFAFRHIGATSGIALTLFIAGVVVLLLYNPASDALRAPSWGALLLLFFLQQLYIFVKMLLRVALYGSQAVYYRSARNTGKPEG